MGWGFEPLQLVDHCISTGGYLHECFFEPTCSTPSICDFGGTSPPVAALSQAWAPRTLANLDLSELGPCVQVRNMLGVLKDHPVTLEIAP